MRPPSVVFALTTQFARANLNEYFHETDIVITASVWRSSPTRMAARSGPVADAVRGPAASGARVGPQSPDDGAIADAMVHLSANP